MTVEYDISESLPINISQPKISTEFELKNVAYDFLIDNIPFLSKISNQDKYVRQTAAYKKEQFDNSTEPGEQSLTGWWLRSQLSFHNGAGVKFYEPGTDAAHTSHRFFDSRGVDVWSEGEVKPLKEVVHAYAGAGNIKATVARNTANTADYIITADGAGKLKRFSLSGDSNVTGSASEYTLNAGHVAASHPFYSVTTDGTHYYALCADAVHKGEINNLNSDTLMYGDTNTVSGAFIKFSKGYLFGANGRNLYRADTEHTASNHANGGTATFPSGINLKTHSNADWKWNDIAGGTTHLYASGYAGNNSEIWSIGFDGTGTNYTGGTTETSLPNMPGAVMAAQMPLGEIINCIEYYLGFLVIGTNKGIRVANTGANGELVYGPLLFEGNDVRGLVPNDRFIYAATSVLGVNSKTNACFIRVDLSQSFDDGTFAYAYDLEYLSSADGSDSYATDAHIVDGRLVMIVQEDETAGEVQVESETVYRNGAWLQTGLIRFGTVEPKFYRSVSVKCETGVNDSIDVSIIDQNNNEYAISRITTGLSNYDNMIESPAKSQERVALKFVFNNATTDSALPVLRAWQVKAIPAVRRQRMVQLPLSCFDIEMDRYNQEFGYPGRAFTNLQRLETLEETGKFISVTDYRTNETFTGVIEEIQFLGESSPDKNNDNFGGLVTVTIRKI